jgi:NAD(P)-dependent dehydrogenase (short-subunit alcohol dehydrogenase family)
MSRGACVIAGVGPGNGESFARRFAAEGYRVAMLARSEDYLKELADTLEGAHAFPCDITDPVAVGETFERLRAELGPVEVLVHNAGTFLMRSFVDTTLEDLEHQWRVNTASAFLCAQAALTDMLPRGEGRIIVIGATASLRGGPRFAAFASSKAAQRVMAESMARALGPLGIHVAYVIVDGVISTPRTREWMPDKPDEFFLDPEHIADAVWHLAQQPRSAWTFQLDLRPFGESW